MHEETEAEKRIPDCLPAFLPRHARLRHVKIREFVRGRDRYCSLVCRTRGWSVPQLRTEAGAKREKVFFPLVIFSFVSSLACR